MCQKFVRDQCWRVGSLYGSAIEAWNGARYKHPGDRTPPKGAPTYYKGGSYGHAVIWTGEDIRSTDCTSTGDVSEVPISWVENNWGYTYLGWTEDINGVRVITGGGDDDDMALSEDDVSKVAKRVNQVLGDFTADGDQRDPKNKDPEQANARLNQIEVIVRRLEDKINKL
jgi:hypothetical protein